MKRILLVVAAIFFFLSNGNAQEHSVARKWNDVLLEAIRGDQARPTIHARNLYHTSVVLYDAWAAYDSIASTCFLGNTMGDFTVPFDGITIPEDIQAAQEEAMSYAAYRIIRHRFFYSPGSAETLQRCDSLMNALGYDIVYASTDYSTDIPAALGNYIGDKMIEFGFQDGSNEGGSYANQYYLPVNPDLEMIEPGNPTLVDPNRWQPLALETFVDQNGIPFTTVPPFLSPEWGNLTPFALDESVQNIYFRDGNQYIVYHDPGPAPQLDTLGSREYDDIYRWGFELVSIWASHLDPTDGVMWDISPASMGNVAELPTSYDQYPEFYDLYEGGDPGIGHDINPYTGEPYAPQIVARGDYARVLAEFWADGPHSETPPGHWFTILNYVNDHPMMEHRWMGEGEILPLLEWDVKSYLTLGGAMHDAAITAWGIKGWYDFIRPVSAIRYMCDKGQSNSEDLPHYHPAGIRLNPGYIELIEAGDPLAGDNGEHIGKIKLYTWRGHYYIDDPLTDVAGVGWIRSEDWWPYQRPNFVTPPFAGYVSGHSTFSRAAAEVLTQITGDEYFPGGMGEFDAQMNEYLVFEDGPSTEIILQWATYRDASDQCSLSRIWGGIHPPCDDIPGRIAGIEIGNGAFDKAREYIESGLPHVDAVTADVSIINSTFGGSTFHVTAHYDVEMDMSSTPQLEFIGADLESGALMDQSFMWTDAVTGEFTWNVSGISEEWRDFQIRISGAVSVEGLTQAIWIGDSNFEYDARFPEISSTNPSTDLVNIASVASGAMTTMVMFNEAMDTATQPILIANDAATSATFIYNPVASVWLSNSIFRASFLLADGDIEAVNANFIISNFSDAAGNVVGDTEMMLALTIDTKAPVVDMTLAGTYIIDFDNYEDPWVGSIWFDEAMNQDIIPNLNFANGGTSANIGAPLNVSQWVVSDIYYFAFEPTFVVGTNFLLDFEVTMAEDIHGNPMETLILDEYLEVLLDPTLIGEFSGDSGLTIYPNPLRSDRIINIDGVQGNELNVQISDMAGKLVHLQSFQNNTGTLRLDLNNLALGVYNLTLINGSNSASTRLIITE